MAKLEADSDSSPEDGNPPPPKKSAPAASSGDRKRPAPKGNPAVEGDEPTWELGQMKKLKVREFKGKVYIDIREWYVDKDTMDTKPGKKGISLNPLQYQALKAAIPEIDAALP